MKNISTANTKKQIKAALDQALKQALGALKIATPSKKLGKTVDKAITKLAKAARKELKKKVGEGVKKVKAASPRKLVKKKL